MKKECTYTPYQFLILQITKTLYQQKKNQNLIKFKRSQLTGSRFFKLSMKKPQSKTKSVLLKTKKEENQYADFLQQKLEEQQYLTHLVNMDVKTLHQQNTQLKKLVAKLRAGDKKSNKKIIQLQQNKEKFQNVLQKLQDQNNFLSKKVQRIQSENQKQFTTSEPIETKLVFKQFLANSFPTYKDTIKRILRFFMYIEKYEQNGKEERIKAYNDFIKSIMQKIMLFIFPKRTQYQKDKSIAETMVQKWRGNQSGVQKQLRKQLASLKLLNSQYLEKIQSYEAELIRLRAAKNMLDSKVQNYEKTLKVKASEFVVHLKRALIKKTEYGDQDEAIQQMKQIIQTLQSVVSGSGDHSKNNPQANEVDNNQPNQLLMLFNKSLPNIQMSSQALQTTQNKLSKKTLRKHPILKKNIYGYYEEPQLSTQWNFLTNTKHPDLNKYTQTLPDDLTILITHPVIVVHLFDADIRPKRTRHNTEFYVKIHKNSQSSISSPSVDSPDYKPVWNRKYIIKNYDFPSLRVQLLNKSKGLRDNVVGEGKLSVESKESKVVSIRKQKEYEGRVRFGLHYPKGNIFQFVINSIKVVVPEGIKILTQTVQIAANMNDSIVEKFSNANLVKYLTNKSIFIIQGLDGEIQGRVINRKIFGTVSFNEFTQKQGSKTVTIKAQDWQIILQGYIVLIVSEQSEPERIESSQQGKYFAVRAGYPLLSATYNQQILYSHVKFPLVFNYMDEMTWLQCVMQCQKEKGKTEQIIIDPLLVQGTENRLRSHELLSTPPHIYEFFIQTLQGPQVKFSYQSTLFVKVPEKVKLEISIEIDEKEVEKLDPFMRKGKRKLAEKEVQKIEFFIETKDLMMNFYKILNRTYKVTGYSKYKLGYCKISNLLISQGQDNKKQISRKQIQKKQITIDQPLQGEYYISFCVSKGYFPSFSSSASYAIQLSTGNDCMRTEFVKGELLVWQHIMLMKFNFGKDKSPEFMIKVIESPLIGNERVAYECIIPMASNILKLSRLVLNLSSDQHQLQSKSLQQYDILILSSISIPQHLYSIYVDRIEVEVEEEADWFSKIDPYIVFLVNGKKVHYTTVQDNAGDNSQWDNIGFRTILSEHSNTQAPNQMFKLKIYDQDFINDDYIGQCSLIFDPQIASSNNLIQCIRSKVIKQDKVCGCVRIHGKFKKIKQNSQQILTHSFTQLSSTQYSLYHLCITEINFSNNKLLQNGEKLKISYANKKEYKYVEKQIQHKAELLLKNVNFSIWTTINTKQSQNSTIEFRLTTSRKDFFKIQQIDLGQISINKQQLANITRVCCLNISIVFEKSKQKGFAKILVEPIYKSKYMVIDCYSSGTELNLLSRKQNYQTTLFPSMKGKMDPLREEFGDIYLFSEEQQYEIKWKQNQGKYKQNQRRAEDRVVVGNDSLREVYCLKGESSKYPLNNQCLTVYNIHKHSKLSHLPLIYSRDFVSNSSLSQQNKNIKISNKVFCIKTLHWEPLKFQSLKQHEIELKFGKTGNLRITKRQNDNFNQYYVIGKADSSLVLFSQYALPYQMVIHESDSHNNKSAFIICLLQHQSVVCSQKYAYFQHFGALYYELEEYKNKYRRVYFSKLFIKIYSPKILNSQEPFSLKLSVQGSPLTYSAKKFIGNCGWLFQEVQFYLPLDSISNFVKLEFTAHNNTVQQCQSIKLERKLNKWDYLYQQTQHYTLHAEFIIDSDPNITSILPQKPALPTQISFIQLQSLEIRPSADLHNTQMKVKFSLHNQLIEFKANRNDTINDTFSYQITQKQLLYIDQSQPSIIKVEIVQQKIFGDTLIGSALIPIQKHQLNFGYTSKFAPIINNQQVVLGKVSVGFKPLSEVSFLYVDVDRIVPNNEYKALTVQLVPFGTDKRKLQRVNMQLLQQSPAQLSQQQQRVLPFHLNYDTKQDLIVSEHDYQDYTVHISDTSSNQLLGKFKLCDLIKKDNSDHYQHIEVIHPLRLTKLELNGLVRINYIESVSAKKELYNENKQQTIKEQQGCVYLSLTEFKFLNQLSSPAISLVIQSARGKLFTQQLNFSKTPLTIALRQQQKITLFIRRHQQTALVAFAIIDVSAYLKNDKQLVVFASYIEPEVVYALCRVDIKMIKASTTLYEIVEVKAKNLTDMELFVDMNPYVVVQSNYHNQNEENNYQLPQSYYHKTLSTFFTQVSSGKTNLWWKLGLILQDSFKITLFDRDVKFDDYIGQTSILKQQLQKDFTSNQNNLSQQEKPIQYNKNTITKTMRLTSLEDNNKDAGVIELTIRRIVLVDNQQNTIKQQAMQRESQQKGVYCVMMDGFCGDALINRPLQEVTSFTISLQSGFVLYSLQAPYPSHPNLIVNILKSGPILLSEFAFSIESNRVQRELMIEVETKMQRLRQTMKIKELLHRTVNKTIKFECNGTQKLFENCQLIPLKEAILIDNDDSQQVNSKSQLQQSAHILLINSLTLWLLNNQFNNNVITLTILIHDSSMTRSRQYSLQISPYQSKQVHAKQGCLIIDLQKCLLYQIHIQSTDRLQIILTNQGYAQPIKTKLSLDTLTYNPHQHQVLIQSCLWQQQSNNIGSIYIELQSISDSHKFGENQNQRIMSLNYLRKKITTVNKSLLSWLEFRVKKATFYKDIQIFSKMDPYYIAELTQSPSNHFNQFLQNQFNQFAQDQQPLKQSFKSSVQQNAGTHPVWENDKFFFYLTSNKPICWLSIRFIDKQVIKDRPLGYSRIDTEDLISSMRQGVLQRQIGILKEESSQSEQMGTAVVCYNVIHSYIIFLALHSLDIAEKLMIKTVQQVDLQSKIPPKLQQLHVMKSYPISPQTLSVCISCGSQSKNIEYKQLLRKAQGELCFIQHSVAIKYMFFH